MAPPDKILIKEDEIPLKTRKRIQRINPIYNKIIATYHPFYTIGCLHTAAITIAFVFVYVFIISNYDLEYVGWYIFTLPLSIITGFWIIPQYFSHSLYALTDRAFIISQKPFFNEKNIIIPLENIVDITISKQREPNEAQKIHITYRIASGELVRYNTQPLQNAQRWVAQINNQKNFFLKHGLQTDDNETNPEE